MLYFPNHNNTGRGVRLLGREVIELHRILLLEEFLQAVFFPFSFLGGDVPPLISFHSLTVLCVSCDGWMSVPQGGRGGVLHSNTPHELLLSSSATENVALSFNLITNEQKQQILYLFIYYCSYLPLN